MTSQTVRACVSGKQERLTTEAFVKLAHARVPEMIVTYNQPLTKPRR